jgi:DNA repair and recombination RAD54-like protein
MLSCLFNNFANFKERDRVVVISNYTQTLDLIQELCNDHTWPVTRLDGSIGLKKIHSFRVEKMCSTKTTLVSSGEDVSNYTRNECILGVKKRHELVKSFNDLNNPKAFVFLLSSKAGGCGINLIGNFCTTFPLVSSLILCLFTSFEYNFMSFHSLRV